MGIPSFLKWIREKYPKSISKHSAPGKYDILLLDMNNIIHSCCHSGDGNLHDFDEKEMISKVFVYLEHTIELLQPRHCLYLAVDGVGPRAKINQQRARRYESARNRRKILEEDDDIQEDEDEGMQDDLMAEIQKTLDLGILGGSVLEQQEELHRSNSLYCPSAGSSESSRHVIDNISTQGKPLDYEYLDKLLGWDRNCITPGTEFMHRISLALHGWAAQKVANGEGIWAGLNIVVSDSYTPGEGEHKMIDFVRTQRSCAHYHNSMTAGLCGMDADLVLLALSLHDNNIDVVREIRDHGMASAPGSVQFETIMMAVLRQYLEVEFAATSSPSALAHPNYSSVWSVQEENKPILTSPVNIDRIIDDFILISFFVGNDFIPHLPACLMDRCSMDNLLNLYKFCLPKLPRYLTNTDGSVDWKGLGIFLKGWAKCEDANFLVEVDQMREEGTLARPIVSTPSEPPRNTSFGGSTVYEPSLEELLDTSWRGIYYSSIGVNEMERYNMCKEYCKGLSWMYNYYTNVPDNDKLVTRNIWSWFYPYHYAPFAHDIADFLLMLPTPIETDMKTPSKPLTPFQQLMAVLPSDSGILVPEELRFLYDKELKHLYPNSYEIDPDGRQEEYKHVVMLPFIDGALLAEKVSQVKVKEQSLHRNTVHDWDTLYLAKNSTLEKGSTVIMRSGRRFALAGQVVSQGVNSVNFKFPAIAEISKTHQVIPHQRVHPVVRLKRTSNTPLSEGLRGLTTHLGSVFAAGVAFELFRNTNTWVEKFQFVSFLTAIAVQVWAIAFFIFSDVSREKLNDQVRKYIKEPFASYKDWICPQCGRRNFDRRETCFRCESSRRGHVVTMYTPKVPISAILLDHSHRRTVRARVRPVA